MARIRTSTCVSRTLLRVLGLLGLIVPALAPASDPFPVPAGLEPAVAFWTRVYTEIDSRSGFIHDERDLGIVYETLRLEPDLSRRQRKRLVRQRKAHYRRILEALARDPDGRADPETRRVRALFPPDASGRDFARAAGRLRFQLGQADRFLAGLERAGAWEDHIREHLRNAGVPEALAALPHVESSYNPAAWSKVGAAGLWQFTRATGRRYLRVDHVVDERLDPFRATDAAARLLLHNHELTGSWPLAITAYNHGVAGVRRARKKLGTDDIGEIVARYRGRTFGFASRNFYAAFLAARHVAGHAEQFFGPVRRAAPRDDTTVEVPAYVPAEVLAETLGTDLATLRELNPALRPPVWAGTKHVPRGYGLHVPMDPARALARLEALPPGAVYAHQVPDRFYRVQPGDTLSAIASRYDTSLGRLVELNTLSSRHLIRVGQVLRLPGAEVTGQTPARYRVRRGDTLSQIARRFRIAESDLLAINAIGDPDRIYPGQTLHLARIDGAPSPRPAAAAAAAPTPGAVAATAGGTADAPPAPRPGDRPETPAGQEETPGIDDPLAHPALEADPTDYSVSPGGYITVQAAETLGHYAEWLGVRASRLRHLNHMRYGEPVVVGRRLRLDLSRVTPEAFVAARRSYHEGIQAAFFSRYRITGTVAYRVRQGDSVWELARDHGVPLWLLRQYNPELDPRRLRPGGRLTIPVLREQGQDAAATANA